MTLAPKASASLAVKFGVTPPATMLSSICIYQSTNERGFLSQKVPVWELAIELPAEVLLLFAHPRRKECLPLQLTRASIDLLPPPHPNLEQHPYEQL